MAAEAWQHTSLWLDGGHPLSEALKITERYRRRDFGHMDLEQTVEDFKIYAKPITFTIKMSLIPDTDLIEFVCTENERDHRHLVGKASDDKKYAVVEALTQEYTQAKDRGDKILGQNIVDLITVNGVRVVLEDGTWGLVRASSNKPSLVVVVESPASETNMRAMFKDLDARLSKHPEVGDYDQKI